MPLYKSIQEPLDAKFCKPKPTSGLTPNVPLEQQHYDEPSSWEDEAAGWKRGRSIRNFEIDWVHRAARMVSVYCEKSRVW
jgi:hypothetical protein